MDTVKHLDFFNARDMHWAPVAVIGAGATGSATAIQLAMLGLPQLNIYDFDKVESHNISNQQAYTHNNIGDYKSMALSFYLNVKVGNNIAKFETKGIKCESKQNKYPITKLPFAKTVFFCMDSMKARKEIWQSCIKMDGFTELLIDMRINATSGQINVINPQQLKYCRLYEETLYDDSEVDLNLGNCGVVQSIGATAALAASYATWLFMEYWNEKNKDVFQLNFSIRPMFMSCKSLNALLEG